MSDAASIPVGLSHVRADGSAHMVDVTDKAVTSREATARGVLRTRADVVDRIARGDLPKGEALATARIAGIMGAKRTSDLVPMCHPLPLSGVELDLVPQGDRVEITARVRTQGVTGVEMEALTAVTVAALTLFDMIKAVDHLAVIDGVQVLAKSGGKSGDWTRESETAGTARIASERETAEQKRMTRELTAQEPTAHEPTAQEPTS
ncbi:cyclic pyranopterin phosphate synthase [Brachybacterium tyrofermentans]